MGPGAGVATPGGGAILCFLRWARREGNGIDERILDLVAPRVPQKEPTVYRIAQLHQILDACSPDVPAEELVPSIRMTECIIGKS